MRRGSKAVTEIILQANISFEKEILLLKFVPSQTLSDMVW